MKLNRILLYSAIVLLSSLCTAQTYEIDSIKSELKSAGSDTNRVNTLLALSSRIARISAQEAIKYSNEALDLAQTLSFPKGEAYALKGIGMGYYFESNYPEVLYYWQKSLEAFAEMGDKQGMANMLSNIGAVYFNGGDGNKAIEYHLEALRIAEEIGDTLRIATTLVNIGAVYNNKEATYDQAIDYYLRSLDLGEQLGDMDAIGTAAVNIGGIYLAREDDELALSYFEKALEAYNKTETGNVAYTLFMIGNVYGKRGNYDLAIEYQTEAYDLAKSHGAKLEMAQALVNLAESYMEAGNTELALKYFEEGRDISIEIGANYELQTAYEGLASTYIKLSDYQNAYKNHEEYAKIKDTNYNAEMDKRIQALTLNYDLDKKQGQIDLLTKDKELQELDLRRQKTFRNAIGITGILLLILVGGLFNRYKYVRRTKKIIEYEKALSEKLLLNILPEETAEELKKHGSATPKHYDMVSVLFTDFKGFTKIAEKLTPEELVEELNQCFLEFDRIIDRHNLEKIKTIGDAYMCAGGIPAANTTNPTDIVQAGLEIKRYMENLKKDRESRGEDYWELRIGIHTGPVIAGVVGKNKFAYDIWGDAVNTASRMESSGIPGKVNISGTTYELIQDQFECTYRGKIQAKNKGEIDMYIVEKENRVDS